MKKLKWISLVGMFFVALPTWSEIIVGKTYQIAPSVDETKSLFVNNSSLSANAEVVCWTNTDVGAQQWEAVELADGNIAFKNVYTHQFLARAVKNSNTIPVQIANSSLGAAKWTVQEDASVENGYNILLKTTSSSKYLTTESTIKDGDNPTMQNKKVGKNASTQIWIITEVEPKELFTVQTQQEMMNGWVKQFLRNRGTNLTTFGEGGGWGDAEMMETMLDAYETTGNEEYLKHFTTSFNYFKKYVGSDFLKLVYTDEYKWYGHDFNDDVMWMILASIRAYFLTGQTTYRSLAKQNFDAIYKRAYNQWGMMRWAENSGDKNGTNSCINGPTEVAACYLGLATGDESYFSKARSLYANQRAYLYNASTGQVYDSFIWSSSNKPESYNYWSSTYNQGTMLGAAVMLYQHYGDETYRQDAEKIMSYTMKNLCNSQGIVSTCQTANGDLCGFKGIFMRYARKYILATGDTKYEKWCEKNALHAYNNRSKSGLICSAWLTKSAEDGLYDSNTYTDQPFGCSTALSAAFNSIMRDNLVRDAYAQTEAEQMDGLRQVYAKVIEGCSNNCVLGNIKNDYYSYYQQMNFGEQEASWMLLRVSTKRVKSITNAVEVHLDSLNGPCIANIDVPDSTDWLTLKTPITPTKGIHTVYLKYKSSSSVISDCFKVDWFRFSVQEPSGVKPIIQEDNIISFNYVSSASKLQIGLQEDSHLFIYAANGSLLMRTLCVAGSHEVLFQEYPKGTYLIKVVSAHATKAYKVIVSH